jgi:hypothetical protein
MRSGQNVTEATKGTWNQRAAKYPTIPVSLSIRSVARDFVKGVFSLLATNLLDHVPQVQADICGKNAINTGLSLPQNMRTLHLFNQNITVVIHSDGP